jgi:hypothetical protein
MIPNLGVAKYSRRFLFGRPVHRQGCQIELSEHMCRHRTDRIRWVRTRPNTILAVTLVSFPDVIGQSLTALAGRDPNGDRMRRC